MPWDNFPVESLASLPGIIVVSGLVEAIYGAFPKLAKGARGLLGIILGECWCLFVTAMIDGDLRRAAVIGIIVGLAATNPRAALIWQHRRDAPTDEQARLPRNRRDNRID